MPFELDENEGFESISRRTKRRKNLAPTPPPPFQMAMNFSPNWSKNLARRNLINQTIDWHSLANFLSVLCERNFEHRNHRQQQRYYVCSSHSHTKIPLSERRLVQCTMYTHCSVYVYSHVQSICVWTFPCARVNIFYFLNIYFLLLLLLWLLWLLLLLLFSFLFGFTRSISSAHQFSISVWSRRSSFLFSCLVFHQI